MAICDIANSSKVLLYVVHGGALLWHMCNGKYLFTGISLRNRLTSGAIDPTSRKGVGPGLWWSAEGVCLKVAPVPEPYV